MPSRVKRIQQIRLQAKNYQADTVVLTDAAGIRWATGFTGSDSLVIIRPRATHLVTDGRFAEQAHRQTDVGRVHIASGPLTGVIKDQKILSAARRIAYQADRLTVVEAGALRKTSSARWVATTGLLRELVARKDVSELKAIKKAQAITAAVFSDILPLVKPGVREKDLAAEIVYRQLKRGAERMPTGFDPVVASGSNSAMPHAEASRRKIKRGDMVVFDFGCVVDGYCSDMARTVAVGKPTARAKEVYGLVLRAQTEAISRARAGIQAKTLDAVAREIITDGGYGRFFSHSLGHGVGLSVHEWPTVSFLSTVTLPERAVITIEPGIYLRRKFGVRIEDMILLKPRGNENLTRVTKNLLVL